MSNILEKRNYYYLVSGLPDMVMEQSHPPFSLTELLEVLCESLHPGDFQWVEWIFLPNDNRNLLALLQKSAVSWDERGRFSRQEMEEKLLQPGRLPVYMDQFYLAFQQETPLWPEMSWENQLTALFYDYVLTQTKGFLHNWFQFERDLKNLLSACNIRKYHLPGEGQYIGQNLVTESIEKTHARDFGLSGEIPFLDRVLHAFEHPSPLDREKAIDRIKWDFIDEQNTFHYFTLEVVLGYLLQFLLLDRWLHLHPDKGKAAVNQKIRELEHPAEYLKMNVLA